MTKEQLMAQGLTDAQADAVIKLHNDTLNGTYVPKHRFDEVNTELTNTKQQVTDRDKQIADLKKFEGDATSLKAKVEDLEKQNKTAADEYATKLATERKQNAVKLALLSDEAGKPHDADMVLGLFKLDAITVDESGKIVSGYKEQNETIRKEKAFLFDAKQETNQSNNPPANNWKPMGNPPSEGDKGNTKPDEFVNFGKAMAQQSLSMMGIVPTDKK